MHVVIRAYMHKIWTSFFVVLIFFIFLSHLIDFPLVRLMDMSIWFTYNFVTDESYQNFIEMLRASSISLSTWLMGIVFGCVLIAAGIYMFRFLKRCRTNTHFFFHAGP